MGFTNFPNGITSFGVPVLPSAGSKMTTGSVWFVDSSTGSDSGKGTKSQPFATLDYAVGKCTANKGDMIYVMPNHAETLTADSGVDIDVAGVTVIGLGNGENRPTITFTTATTADFKIAANNVTVANLVFKCNIASQDMMIEVTGDDAEIAFCDFREGTATGKTLVTLGVADNDADRCFVHDCKFYMPTAGNGDAAISFAKDHAGVRLERLDVYGDFDLAGIDIPTAGNAQVDCVIKDVHITNLLSGQHAIQVNGSSSTGKIINAYIVTDALTTAIDAGGLEMFECYHNIGTDQGGWTRVVVEPDSTSNMIGANDNNNDFDSSNVVANEDGSVFERLEQIQEATNDGTGTSLPSNTSIYDQVRAFGQGYLVSKTASVIGSASSTVSFFTVTGEVEVAVAGYINSAVTSSGAATLEVGVASATAGLIAQTSKSNLTADLVWVDSAPSVLESRPSYKIIANGADISAKVGTAATTAGDVTLYCWWRPLSSDGDLSAA